MKRLIQRIKDHFYLYDYMEFKHKLTDIEKRNIYDYVDGKKYMSKYPTTRKDCTTCYYSVLNPDKQCYGCSKDHLSNWTRRKY